jgi:ribosomal protein S18 acetylase RimI-like enzyme
MTLPAISQRPVGPHDEPFLRKVYATTRAEEMALVDWDDTAKEAFLAAQFEAQALHYRTHYPDGDFDIILVDEAPAGRLYVHRSAREIALLDIALLPRQRNRGIGTRLITGLLEEGAGIGAPVRLHVERFNERARSLYDRLGFRPIEDRGVYIAMEWVPTRVVQPQLVMAGS